jgi:hypothetical protein
MIVLVKRAIFAIVTVLIWSVVLLLPAQTAVADSCPPGTTENPTTGACETTGTGGNAGNSGASGTCTTVDASFLFFPTWYRGLDCDADANGNISINIGQGSDPAKTIFTIALNVVDILLRLVGILAVGFVIYGGIRDITSQGEPEKAKQALDTILKAVIGMVIAMIAAVAVSFIVSRLSA